MNDASTGSSGRSAPPLFAAVALAAGLVAMAGGLWDDAWHTERGRDDFFIAPHIAIYAGIAVAGLALTLWVISVVAASGSVRGAVRGPLALACLSVVVTLASGPIDNAWHEAFGRDAVIWSPPHMLGIAGTLSLGAALLVALASRPGPIARLAAYAAAGLVLASAMFAVVEYETDVPQFDEVWYLPVASLAATVGLSLARSALGGRWSATLAAVAYTAFVGAVSAFLVVLDFAAPAAPLVIAPAIALDVAARRRWSPPVAAAAFTGVLFAFYAPVRNVLGDGIELDAADVALGLPLAWAAALTVLLLTRGLRSSGTAGQRTAVATTLVVGLACIAPAVAAAHDPGQGDDAGVVDLSAVARDDLINVTANLGPDLCRATRPVAVVARRAGEVARGRLDRDGCRLSGTVAVSGRGRWFVYTELTRDGRPVEAWLPVTVGVSATRTTEAGRYAYIPSEHSASTFKFAGGVLLYAGMLALLLVTFRLIATPAAQLKRRSHME